MSKIRLFSDHEVGFSEAEEEYTILEIAMNMFFLGHCVTRRGSRKMTTEG